MKAFVNDIEVRTYYGAKVKSVVLAYCRANNLPLNLEGIADTGQHISYRV